MSHGTAVIASEDYGLFGFMSSSFHYYWAVAFGSSLGESIRYTPTDVFETLPRPVMSGEVRHLGSHLDSIRSDVMNERRLGITSLYNLIHDPACMDSDVGRIRDAHKEVDAAVSLSYGWVDLADAVSDCGFYSTRQGVRYTFGSVFRQEILDRLLELNHERYAAEQAAGKPGKGRPKTARGMQGELFG